MSPGDDGELKEDAARHGFPFLQRIQSIDPGLSSAFPIARSLIRYKAVTISCANGVPRIAIGDPSDYETLDIVAFFLKKPIDDIDFVVCPPGEIMRAIRMFYS